MKKYIAVLGCLVLIFSLAGCAKAKTYKKIGETPTLTETELTTEESTEEESKEETESTLEDGEESEEDESEKTSADSQAQFCALNNTSE